MERLVIRARVGVSYISDVIARERLSLDVIL
jgi:hypothetical protein